MRTSVRNEPVVRVHLAVAPVAGRMRNRRVEGLHRSSCSDRARRRQDGTPGPPERPPRFSRGCPRPARPWGNPGICSTWSAGPPMALEDVHRRPARALPYPNRRSGRARAVPPQRDAGPSGSRRTPDDWLERWMASVADLAELKASHPMLDAVIDEQRGRQIRIGDHWLADFASCNYLGFDLDQEIIDAVPEYLARWGTHPSWSRLLGSPVMYEQIEAKVTDLLGCEDTLLLPTITHIHMSVIPVLAGSGVIFLDNRAHKTIYDGAMMARGYGATVVRFRHDDHQHLEELLKVCKVTPRVIAMDGVNSMTGNAPDIAAFARLAREHDALLYVDDAHGFGVIGERSPDELCDWGTRGNGVVRHQGESYDNVIFVAGFSKSYSSLLSFLALPTRLKDVLKVAAPPYLYSGPSPVASLATTLVGLEVNDKRGDLARYEIFRKTDRVLRCLARARHLHAQPLRLPGDRGAARPPRGHRRGRPLPLRPGHLRDARRVSPRPQARGRVPDPGDRREHRRRDRAPLRRCSPRSTTASTCSTTAANGSWRACRRGRTSCDQRTRCQRVGQRGSALRRRRLRVGAARARRHRRVGAGEPGGAHRTRLGAREPRTGATGRRPRRVRRGAAAERRRDVGQGRARQRAAAHGLDRRGRPAVRRGHRRGHAPLRGRRRPPRARRAGASCGSAATTTRCARSEKRCAATAAGSRSGSISRSRCCARAIGCARSSSTRVACTRR